MRTVLLIAYHYPPVQGSSGVQRTLRFSQHLPKFGWRPIVLTITPRAYEAVTDGHGNEIPGEIMVDRAFGFDAARQLSVFGRYPQRLALPDRWATWKPFAITSGKSSLRLSVLRRDKLTLKSSLVVGWWNVPLLG